MFVTIYVSLTDFSLLYTLQDQANPVDHNGTKDHDDLILFGNNECGEKFDNDYEESNNSNQNIYCSSQNITDNPGIICKVHSTESGVPICAVDSTSSLEHLSHLSHEINYTPGDVSSAVTSVNEDKLKVRVKTDMQSQR